MTQKPNSLDAIISEQGYHDRIETSATLGELLARLDPEAESRVKTFSREGLGLWKAVGVAFGGIGEAFVAVPAGIKGAGCSIWFRKGGALSGSSLAGAIAALWADNPPAFIAPDGKPVIPGDATVKRRRGAVRATSRIVHTTMN